MSLYTRPIEWHEECVRNHRATLENEKRQLEGLLRRIEKSEEQLAFHELQIEEAKRLGKTSFDRDRFLANKNPSKV